jgi:hypothetical protein
LRTWLQEKSIFGINFGVNWNKLKSEDLIIFLGGLVGQMRGLIARILKFNGQLWTWLKKSKIKDQIEKGVWMQGLKLIKLGAKLKKLKVC